MAGTVTFIELVSGAFATSPGKAVDGTTVTGWISLSSLAVNTDFYLTGSSSLSEKVSATWMYGFGLGAGINGEPWNFSSGGADEGNHIFAIINIGGSPNTLANGGYGIVAADDLAVDSVGCWYVGPQPGSTGGWEYFVINPAEAFDKLIAAGTAVWTTGGNPSQLSGVDGLGCYWDVTNSVMGSSDNAWLQTVSVGAGYRVTGTGCTFADFSGYEQTNRFGALQVKSGILFPLCKLRIGIESGAGDTTFSDSGFTVVWQGQQRPGGGSSVATGFYELSVIKGSGSTTLTLSNGSLVAASPAQFDLELNGATTVTITNLSVDRARVVTLDSAVTWTGGTVKNSGQIDASGATFTGVSVLTSAVATDVGALYWNSATDPDGYLDDCVFSMGGNSHHAIEFGTSSPTTINLNGIICTGFTNTIGSSAAPLYIKRTTGVVNIYLTNCSGITVNGYKTDGATVNIISGAVTVKVTAKTSGGTPIQSARVILKASDASYFPYNASVSITRSGSTATVSHTGHGMATNDYVAIDGADQPEYNGVQQITYIDANSYSFTVTGTPATPATGSPTATFVALFGLTDVNGEVSTSRVYSSAQPVVGWARKSSASPYYKEGVLTGSVSTTAGFDQTAVMISDE